jgi:O-antigen ligase
MIEIMDVHGLQNQQHTFTSSSVRSMRHKFLLGSLFVFIVGLMTVSHFSELSKLMILYGMLLGWLFLICFFYFKLKLQPEVILYCAWVAWSIIGIINAIELSLSVYSLTTIIQIAMLIFIVAGITALNRSLFVVMLAITIGGIIVTFSSYYSGELQSAANIASKTRSAGITANANSFAYHLLFVVIAIFYFWKQNSSIILRIFLPVIFTISMIGIVYYGSRKGFIGALAFIILWFLFCESRKFSKSPFITLITLLMISGMLYFMADYVMSNTNLGRRLENTREQGAPKRMQMYVDGFKMIRSNPITGVGLNNYSALSTSGLYSHSDYVEVAANTGIVGFMLYFSIYAVLWRRLNRIKAMADDPRLLYVIGLLKAAILTILLVAFGRPNITSKLTWIFLAGAIGYSWSIERVLRTKFLTK